VMGPGHKYLTRVGSIFCGSGRVSHLWFEFEFGKFALKTSNFSIFFPSGQKNLFGSGRKVPGSKAGWPLIYCGSKVSLGWVGSGQGPSLITTLISMSEQTGAAEFSIFVKCWVPIWMSVCASVA